MDKNLKKERIISRLWRHHLPLVLCSLIASYGVNLLINSDYTVHRWSMATGYVALVLLGITLILGPVKMLFQQRIPKSFDLRRDAGIWCGIVGLLHVIIGLQVHMGNPWLYFFLKDPFPQKLVLRGDLFGFANYTGLIATVIILLLLLISNDLSIKKLGSKRWKALQRWNYGLFGLVVAHSIAFQVIEKRILGFVIFFSLITVAVIFLQSIGFLKWEK